MFAVPTRGNFSCKIFIVPRDKTQNLNEAFFFQSRENKQHFGLNDEIKRHLKNRGLPLPLQTFIITAPKVVTHASDGESERLTNSISEPY